MKVVMFVDDERLIIKSLEDVFNDEQYKYVFINSGEDALEYMESNHVDLICTDIVMPGMNGFSLLREIKKRYPLTIRIAISSFHNNNMIKRLIEENLAQYYVFKPWDENELKQSIHKIINMQTALYTREMLEFVNGLKDLPTIPKMFIKLSEMIVDESPIEAISVLIEEDPAISATVLKVANSAYYGRKTGEISQAIMNIGLNGIKDIVLAHSVFNTLTHSEKALDIMWRHAAMSNKIMTGIYKEVLKKPLPRMFASAGLLHNIGRLVFYANEADYQKVLDDNTRSEESISQEEKVLYGVCHQDLGGYLLNSWDLPFAYVEAAMYHHRPSDYRIVNRDLVCVIHIAHYFAQQMEENCFCKINEIVYSMLNITASDVEDFVKTLK